MREAYSQLHTQSIAHSIESWHGGELVGGLYGIALGGAFFGESMFTHKTDASKVGLVTLIRQLQTWGFDLFDCQVTTGHLAVKEISLLNGCSQRIAWEFSRGIAKGSQSVGGHQIHALPSCPTSCMFHSVSTG